MRVGTYKQYYIIVSIPVLKNTSFIEILELSLFGEYGVLINWNFLLTVRKLFHVEKLSWTE